MRCAWLGVVVAVSGCGSSPSGVDGRPIDASAGFDSLPRCGADLFFTGEYVDWDSTTTNFKGIFDATFTVVGDPSRTDQTAPNGRVEMCIPATGRSLINVQPPATGTTYLPGHYIADAAVFASGRTFSVKGMPQSRTVPFYELYGVQFDANKLQLLVEVQGPLQSLSLTDGTAEKVLGFDGTNWSVAASGKYVLFANVVSSAVPTLHGAAIGSGPVPMVPGELTMTTVVGE